MLDPESNAEKIYHVRIDRLQDEAMLDRLQVGMVLDGERLVARSEGAGTSYRQAAASQVELSRAIAREPIGQIASLDVASERLNPSSHPLVALQYGQWRHAIRPVRPSKIYQFLAISLRAEASRILAPLCGTNAAVGLGP